MAKFVLQPCKIRGDRVVPTKDPPVELDGRQLIAKLAPNRLPHNLLRLRQARLGSFIGRCKGSRSGREVLFTVWNPDRSNKIGWLLKQDAAFPDRLIEIYRLVEADWGSRFVEADSGKKDRLPGDKARRTPRMVEGTA